MIRRPPRSTQSRSSAASDVYKRQGDSVRPWNYVIYLVDMIAKRPELLSWQWHERACQKGQRRRDHYAQADRLHLILGKRCDQQCQRDGRHCGDHTDDEGKAKSADATLVV